MCGGGGRERIKKKKKKKCLPKDKFWWNEPLKVCLNNNQKKKKGDEITRAGIEAFKLLICSKRTGWIQSHWFKSGKRQAFNFPRAANELWSGSCHCLPVAPVPLVLVPFGWAMALNPAVSGSEKFSSWKVQTWLNIKLANLSSAEHKKPLCGRWRGGAWSGLFRSVVCRVFVTERCHR